jgi:pilus assembly protein CpaF
MVAEVIADASGLGPLYDLVRLPEVTDVLVHGHFGVWLDRGRGLEPQQTPWNDEAEVRHFAARLALSAGVRLDDLRPYADFMWTGIRCHIAVPPISERTCISLRIPQQHVRSLASVTQGQHADVHLVLTEVIRQRRSFLISGGTGSGKSTMLAAMLGGVSESQRIVVVEDTAELAIVHPHVVMLRGRPSTNEGVGELGLMTLVRQSLRMRPDVLVVGEIRGAEVVDLLMAMNTGHFAGGTVHANSIDAVPARLHSLGWLAGLSPAAIDAQTAVGIDCLIHMQRDGSRRYVAQVNVMIQGKWVAVWDHQLGRREAWSDVVPIETVEPDTALVTVRSR